MAVPAPEILDAAEEAGLRYASDDRTGIRRHRAGRGFRYVGPDGEPVSDEADLKRIKRLAIPPAWTDVWICTDPRGHLQATGRDAKGRKQYRYHERFRAMRDETKYERILEFAHTLPKIRARVDADLRSAKLTRERVLAAIVDAYIAGDLVALHAKHEGDAVDLTSEEAKVLRFLERRTSQ